MEDYLASMASTLENALNKSQWEMLIDAVGFRVWVCPLPDFFNHHPTNADLKASRLLVWNGVEINPPKGLRRTKIGCELIKNTTEATVKAANLYQEWQELIGDHDPTEATDSDDIPY